MIILPALIGAGVGFILMLGFWRAGFLAERSGLAVLLSAIAIFYPVFAAIEQDWSGLALHTLIFLGFTALALMGFRRGLYLIAGGLIAHAIFDAGLITLGSPGPLWWPAFCAGVDLIAGIILIRLIQTQKVPA
jgi:ABC-type Na+ efflux pump permease subunit